MVSYFMGASAIRFMNYNLSPINPINYCEKELQGDRTNHKNQLYKARL